MTQDKFSLVQICKNALYLANKTLDTIGNKGSTEVHDEHVVDISTKGDMAVSDSLINFFKKQNLLAILYSEESGRIELAKNPKYTITFDDIDGTYNYYRGRGVLPYCTVVTIFDSPKPCFKDALVAGVLEHNSKNLWMAQRGKGCLINNTKATSSKIDAINNRALIIIDHYMSNKHVHKFLDIYPKSWARDFGSAAFHLAGVSSGMFDAYISNPQKAHEIGAGYLLINESGGILTDWKGKKFDNQFYDFNAQYEVVAASTKKLNKNLLLMLK